MIALSEGLEKNTSLNTLNLMSNTTIGGTKSCTITQSNCTDNKIGCDGLRVLCEALKVNTTITKLDLRGLYKASGNTMALVVFIIFVIQTIPFQHLKQPFLQTC